jgi:dienelactone hydrolase
MLIRLGAIVAAAAIATPTTLYLPTPHGPFPVGTKIVHMVDRDRVDPLVPGREPRELMVQLWYPAVPIGRTAPYMPPLEAQALEHDHSLPTGSISTAMTDSRVDAPALPGRRPVILFYPGLCGDRTDTTFIDQELASAGFVVVAMASTHESAEVEFPGHRLVTSAPNICQAGEDPFSPANQKILQRLQALHVADVRFVLRELGRMRDGPGMDLNRVGMFGHSTGGSTTAEAMHEIGRIKAGIDLDGLILGPVEKTGLHKPFLMFGSDYHNVSMPDPSWQEFLPKLSGWHQWLRLKQAGHYRFTDLAGSSRRWDLKQKLDPQTWTLDFGNIGDRRAMTVVGTYVTAFFELFLGHRSEPILNHPSSRFPEVQFR